MFDLHCRARNPQRQSQKQNLEWHIWIRHHFPELRAHLVSHFDKLGWQLKRRKFHEKMQIYHHYQIFIHMFIYPGISFFPSLKLLLKVVVQNYFMWNYKLSVGIASRTRRKKGYSFDKKLIAPLLIMRKSVVRRKSTLTNAHFSKQTNSTYVGCVGF